MQKGFTIQNGGIKGSLMGMPKSAQILSGQVLSNQWTDLSPGDMLHSISDLSPGGMPRSILESV